MCRLVEPVWVS